MIKLLGVALALSFASPSPPPWKVPAARAHFDEGRKLQEDGIYPFAIDQLQMSLAKEPRPETELALGECFSAMEQPLLAAVHFARYLEKAPKDAEVRNRLGCLQLRLGKLEEARASFTALRKLDPPSAATGLMQVELKLGDRAYAAEEYEEATAHFKAAVQHGGTDARALDGIAKCRRALDAKKKSGGKRQKAPR